MNTSKLISAIATLSLVLFMSVASTANSGIFYSGDLTKSGDKSLSISSASEMDYSYLRFDVSKYINKDETAEIKHSSLDYLRFDVNDFINETDDEAMELPLANEFEYLRFYVDNFTESNTDSIIELPVNEFDYLHFYVNNFITAGNNVIDEMPVTE
jgi:hypothetical protein